MWSEANRSAKRLRSGLARRALPGADSHTLSGVAQTFTEVPGARTVDEFLTGLRAGHGVVYGENGNYLKLTADIFRFAGSLLKEKPWAAVMLPLTVFVTAITAGHWLNEIRFCKRWTHRSKRSKAAENVVRKWITVWRPTGQLTVAPWPWPKTSGGYIENRDHRVMRR